jgi:guanine deaminase
MPPRTIRGRCLDPLPGERDVAYLPDALLEIDENGRISGFGPAPAGCVVPETLPGTVWMPGFVDAHVHFPQTRVVGRSSGALLDWLETTVFPEEARFADKTYATTVAAEFCRALIASGTTTAAIYGSSHPVATAALFTALDRSHLRATVGLTLMDQGAPPALCLDARQALVAAEALVARWHEHDEGRLRFAVTPRFALSCSEALLEGAGELAARLDLPIQTHLSENHAEIAAVRAAFPGADHYVEVYAQHGLCTERTIFGHCIHLSDDEWSVMQAAGAAVAHCPDSNFFLGSGVMPLRRTLERGVRVGLGSDVGAGRTFSLRRIAAAAYDAALVCGARVEPAELLWLATLGGAHALGLGDEIGRLAPGYDADVIAVAAPEVDDRAALLDALLFSHSTEPVRNVLVRGRRAV